jgi:hypothetical protein
MIKPKQVPKESAAAVDDLFENEVVEGDGPSTEEIVAAAINAWPGMRDSKHLSFDGRTETAIVLPLTEKPND